MKTLNIISAAVFSAAALFAGAASADTSREQVIAELAQARASGEIVAMHSEDTANFLKNKSVAATSAVRTPVAFATPIQQVAVSQDTGMFVDSPKAGPGKTRAEVIAELKAARASGELALLQSEDQADASLRLAELRAKKATAMAE